MKNWDRMGLLFRLFHDFAVFDCEVILEKLEGDKTAQMEWQQKHKPVSVSVCSNIKGYDQPKCFVDQELDGLV